MARRRKTVDELAVERDQAKQKAWESFWPKLEAVETFAEAVHSVESSSVDSPGRSYYANLGFFLHHLARPAGASAVEVGQYVRLLECFAAEGAVKLEAVPVLIGRLRPGQQS